MIIGTEILENVYLEFCEYLYQDKNVKIKSFKEDKTIDNWENYKYEVRKTAKEKLLTKFWKQEDIGTGKILAKTKNAIDTYVIYNGERVENNLIDWRKKDNFSKLKTDKKLEQTLFDFFKAKEKDDSKSFYFFKDCGLSYQMIAYLFFIKDLNKYLPISQERFDFIFNEIGLDFKTFGNISWENYLQFNEIVKNVQIFLKNKGIQITLLDAHSFLWIWGWNKKQELEKKQVKQENDKNKENKSHLKGEKRVVRKEQNKENQEETFTILDDNDFIELHKKQIELGHIAEKFVFDSEKKKFQNAGRNDLVDRIEIVSNKIGIGYDIYSFDLINEKIEEKQIEVKSVSKGATKRFFLTRNELNKSKQLSNYHIYLVEDANSDNPKIIEIKHPNIFDKDTFELETVSYEVKYKN